MPTTTQHRIRSEVGGITIDAYPHAASVWMVVVLRLVMGGVMLFAALGKITGSEPFSAYGYLAHVDPASPASGLYAAMATNGLLLDVVNVVVPGAQLLIGVALIAGAFVRLAALGGALQMAAFYLGGWQGDWLALFDNTLVYAIVFAALGAFAAGRVLGVDRYLETLEMGGDPLIDRYPALRYVLG